MNNETIKIMMTITQENIDRLQDKIDKGEYKHSAKLAATRNRELEGYKQTLKDYEAKLN